MRLKTSVWMQPIIGGRAFAMLSFTLWQEVTSPEERKASLDMINILSLLRFIKL